MHRAHRRKSPSSPIALCASLIVLFLSPIHSETATDLSLPTVPIGAVRYVSLKALAEFFAVQPARLDSLTHQATLKLNGHECVFTLLSRTIQIDRQVHLLDHEVIWRNQNVYVPVKSFDPHLKQIAPKQIALSHILDLKIEIVGGATQLILETDGRIRRDQIQLKNLGSDRPRLILSNSRLAPRVQKPGKKGYIQKISLKKQKDKIQIDLRVHKDAVQQLLTREDRRYIFSIQSWTLHTVIIDPGHGGKDPGAIGRKGTKEKTIALQIAKRLKSVLEKKLGVKAILTRGDDTFIPLRRRAQIARQENGKLFVSIHCNAAKHRQAQGWEIYFLSEAKTTEAAEVARKENASLQYEAPEALEDVDIIRSQLLSTQFLKESQDLAGAIKNEVDHISKLKNLGVKQANFYVMQGTMGDMPSVLVECGFLSNAAEEKRLKSGPFQQQMAEAIYQGLKAFKAHYEQSITRR